MVLTPQQINAAWSSAFGKNASQGELDYWGRKSDGDLRGALLKDRNARGVYDAKWKSRSRAAHGQATTPRGTANAGIPGHQAIQDAFIKDVSGTFKPAGDANITPFDQSGFYDEANAKALADAEYNPYYSKVLASKQANDAAETYGLKENVAASGGLESSAFQRDAQLRRTALERAYMDLENEKRGAKDSFVTNRRNEAFQRYLQGIAASQTA